MQNIYIGALMNEYVIGIDIGATKSHLALFDTEANLIDLAHWGPLNHEMMPGSFKQFEEEFGSFVSSVINKNKITMEQVAFSVLGVAGVDTKLQHRIISEILRKLKFGQFILANDAYLGIPAGNPKGSGICAISGSGCTLAGINKEGKMLQIGGVGYLSSDKGGAYYIGRMLLSAVYSELFRKEKATLMTELIFKEIGIVSKYDYVEILSEKIAEKTFNAGSCNRLAFKAATAGDEVAIGILRDVAANYAGGIKCMIEELQFPKEDDIYIVFAGSVFVKEEHPILINMLKEMVSGSNPAYKFAYVKLSVPNVAGAVIWAFNSLNRSGFYDKVCSQMTID